MAENKVDPSELFSSPIKPSDLPSRPKTPVTPKTPTPNPAASGAREREPFDADEVREAALRRELEGVRNINEVIEGVIGTLERAKGNMGVSFFFGFSSSSSFKMHIMKLTYILSLYPDRLQNSNKRLHSPQHMDPHPIADRA